MVQRNRQVISPPQNKLQQTLYEGAYILMAASCIFIGVALLDHTPSDPGWADQHTGTVQNVTGPVGAYLASMLFALLGYASYGLIVLMSWRLFSSAGDTSYSSKITMIRVIGFVLFILASSGLLAIGDFESAPQSRKLLFGGGGFTGLNIVQQGVQLFGLFGTYIALFALFLLGLTFFTTIPWMQTIEKTVRVIFAVYVSLSTYCIAIVSRLWSIARWLMRRVTNILYVIGAAVVWSLKFAGRNTLRLFRYMRSVYKRFTASSADKKIARKKMRRHSARSRPLHTQKVIMPSKMSFISRWRNMIRHPHNKIEPTIGNVGQHDTIPALHTPEPPLPPEPQTIPPPVARPPAQESLHKLPSIDLLNKNTDPAPDTPAGKRQSTSAQGDDGDDGMVAMNRKMAQLLQKQLAHFKINAEVTATLTGPVITRFELRLAPGIKVTKINALEKDLARALAVSHLRVVDIIPGRSVIGIEVPNAHRHTVTLREVLESKNFHTNSRPLAMALGHNIAGNAVIVDLEKMPHLLLAGTTGSGKSVALNSMLMSILFKSPPSEVRMILIDPKVLELSIYEGIPHLLTPVVTDMTEAENALRWCVAEMERRYRLMAQVQVRHFNVYNDKIRHQTPIAGHEPLPLIVIAIDELADLILNMGKKIEELIIRIAQKSRAAGIHLIVATQRPSVNVITGLIKANIPARIAFQVSSRIDSRTILDQSGAENLLGHGDMLYLPGGVSAPVRVHGAYIGDQEVEAVISYWRNREQPDYMPEITQPSPAVESARDKKEELDDLYAQAVQCVNETGRASISSLQRRLRVGYNRAARIIEQMEKEGIVSPMNHKGMREVLLSQKQPP